ncbi:MAG: hypothetical protein C1941_00650 [Prosthecochloris sp.]|nr:hypothetical protein [Prosthecochloris sp.]
MQRSISIVIKVTNSCNLNCVYCYNRDNVIPGVISLSVIENMLSTLWSRFDHADFIWHGGEPLLAGQDFFRTVKALQEKYVSGRDDKSYKNLIQTNGTLVTGNFVEWCRDEDFSIGISIDGPKEITGESRPAFELDAYEKSIEAIETIRSVNDGVGVICVIHKLNAAMGRELYAFFKRIGVDSVVLLPNMNDPRIEPYHLCNNDYVCFHKAFFDAWVADDDPVGTIVPFRQIVNALLGNQPSLCSYSGGCFRNFLSLDVDGSVYPCSAFFGSDFYLGNVNTSSIAEIYDSPKLQQLRAEMKQMLSTECGECEFLTVCQGGCREAAFIASGKLYSKDPHCEGRKELFGYIREVLKSQLGQRLAEKAKYPASNERNWDLVHHR